jgi:hypothetical protein
VLKTIEELVKETYLEVSVLCLFFQQTRRLFLLKKASRSQTRRLLLFICKTLEEGVPWFSESLELAGYNKSKENHPTF